MSGATKKSKGTAGGAGGRGQGGGGGTGYTPSTKSTPRTQITVKEPLPKITAHSGSGGNSNGQGGGSSNHPFEHGFKIHHVPVRVPKLNVKKVTKPMPESPKRKELQEALKQIYVDKSYTQYEYDCHYTEGYNARTKDLAQVTVDTRDLSRNLAEMIEEYIPSPFYYISLGLVYGALLTVVLSKIYDFYPF